MSVTLKDLRQKLLFTFKNESEEMKYIEKLIKVFNSEREKIEEYVLDEKLVSAYVLYFLSTNYAKWEACLARVPRTFWEDLLLGPIIEIGSGPGTFALAFTDWLRVHDLEFSHKWYGIDKSALMIEQANKIVDDDQIIFRKTIPEIKGGTLIFTHSMNEMEISQIENIIHTVKPERVLWIEPGTSEFFQKSKVVREFLIAQKFDVLTPCVANHLCRVATESGDWCHQILHVSHSDDVERLCQKLGRDRRVMPVSFHIYQKNKPRVKSQTALLFQKRKTTKHSFEWRVCLEVEGEMKIMEFEFPKRSLDKAQQERLSELVAGEHITFDLIKELNGEKWRVSLRE